MFGIQREQVFHDLYLAGEGGICQRKIFTGSTNEPEILEFRVYTGLLQLFKSPGHKVVQCTPGLIYWGVKATFMNMTGLWTTLKFNGQ